MRAQRGFATSRDGTRIRYQVIGQGRPLFCCNGLGVPIYFWRSLTAHFADRYQIICWDYRGHGKSGPPPDPHIFCYDDFIADGLAVLEHLDVRHAIAIGHSSGFQVALALYERAPERFAGLASFLGTYGRTLSFFFDSPLSRLWFDLYYILTVFYPDEIRLFLDLFVRTPVPFYVAGMLGILNLHQASQKEMAVYMANVTAFDPHFFAALMQGAEAHSALDILPTVRVPTLLIAAERDRFVPLRITRQMHQLMRDAELYIIPGGSHAGLMENPEIFNERLDRFLTLHEL